MSCSNGGCTRPPRDGLKTCEKCAAKARDWYAANRGRANLRTSMRKFGLTPDDFAAMSTAQAGLCAICEQPETAMYKGEHPKRLAVDHDHNSGKVRGLLCNNCNRAIGMLKDDPAVLRNAADYLERTS